jgi:hypothetical protein
MDKRPAKIAGRKNQLSFETLEKVYRSGYSAVRPTKAAGGFGAAEGS